MSTLQNSFSLNRALTNQPFARIIIAMLSFKTPPTTTCSGYGLSLGDERGDPCPRRSLRTRPDATCPGTTMAVMAHDAPLLTPCYVYIIKLVINNVINGYFTKVRVFLRSQTSDDHP